MYRNSYDGAEEELARLVAARARKLGVAEDQIDDLQQQIVVGLAGVAGPSGPAAPNYPHAEIAHLPTLIDDEIRAHRRRQRRYQERLDRFRAQIALPRHEQALRKGIRAGNAAADVALDVQQVIKSLPPIEQRLCAALTDGLSIAQIAHQWGWSWGRVQRLVTAVRRQFEQVGLDDSPVPTGP